MEVEGKSVLYPIYSFVGAIKVTVVRPSLIREVHARYIRNICCSDSSP